MKSRHRNPCDFLDDIRSILERSWANLTSYCFCSTNERLHLAHEDPRRIQQLVVSWKFAFDTRSITWWIKFSLYLSKWGCSQHLWRYIFLLADDITVCCVLRILQFNPLLTLRLVLFAGPHHTQWCRHKNAVFSTVFVGDVSSVVY